ncbi:MAG TPA: KH domain-containing protein [Thermoanaerobaculia bacterium]|nr:KH domain-containing protein [Thermoanaerobaculia bacterium]HEX3110041.1 KH domain-containing protein [Thermoanaerobaculia bacterium]
MRDLVSFLAKSLVDHPDEVYTSTYDRSDSTVIELEVAEEDLGKVIGRQGRTARAMRTLLSVAGQKSRRRYSLDIID